MTPGAWLDRITEPIAPRWTLKRQRARMASELMARAYDSASAGRRTQGWRRNSGDVNAAIGQGLHRTRDVARDMVRNNSHAASALRTIVNHGVGWGIVAQTPKGSWWKEWAETAACDSEGRLDFAGIQKQVLRTVAEAGECLVRRRARRMADIQAGLPIPLQLQVLEPDYLDTQKEGRSASGGRIIQGVEYDVLGRRSAYWLFPEHPGASNTVVGIGFGASRRIPATEILHVFLPERPGQVRGMSWFAPVVLRMKDFDDYEDAALMKQKIAACLAVITTDVDGTSPALGTIDAAQPMVDQLEPGAILNVTQGRSVAVVQPPTINEHDAYSRTILRAIASGLGLSYEDLTGDFSNSNFSSSRMARIRSWSNVEDWRWRMLILQLCLPVWQWAQDAAALLDKPALPAVPEWTAPAMPSVDPETESNAYKRMVRIGAMSWGEMVRERGYDPDTVLQEIKAWNGKLDQAGVVLDSDPRKTTEAGNPRETAATAVTGGASPAKLPAPANGNGNGVRHPEDQPAPAAKVLALERTVAEQGRALDHLSAQLVRLAVDRGATEHHYHAPASPPIDARTELRVESGAFKAGDVHVAPPAVSAPVTIAEGAVRVEAPVTIADGAVRTEVLAPVKVESPVTIAEGAVQIQQAPAPPTVTVVRAPARPQPEPGSGVAATDAE